eukprot:352421-Chlamydomonas_euryale.AAC.60
MTPLASAIHPGRPRVRALVGLKHPGRFRVASAQSAPQPALRTSFKIGPIRGGRVPGGGGTGQLMCDGPLCDVRKAAEVVGWGGDLSDDRADHA